MTMEYREFRAEPVGINGEGNLYGTALPLNRETVIGDLKRGGWREKAAPGLCNKSIKDGDVLFLAHHDMHQPLARMSAGNLSLREEGNEIRYDVNPVDTSYGRDIRALADAKVLGGVSIGFNPVKDEWYDDDGNPSNRMVGTHRVLREIKLIEISAVTKPAYKDTSIMARDELLAEREQRANDEETRFAVENHLYEELRASSVNTADRKGLAAKGQALPDGSYPIKDKAHLHAAAVLAASHHGNWKAAKKLIRKMAAKLGVALSTLPGFGGKGKGSKSSTSSGGAMGGAKKAGSRRDEGTDERRLKKGIAKRVVQMDAELSQAIELLSQCDVNKLPKEAQDALALVSSAKTHTSHIVGKEKLDVTDAARSIGEPDTSTPEEDDDLALSMAMTQDLMRSSDFVA